MFQPVSLFLGLRYSRSRQGSAFTAFINRFSLLGILLGVAALIVVTSVMNGFEGELKKRILGVVPQVTLTAAQSPLADWQQATQSLNLPTTVEDFSPYVQNQGIAQSQRQLQATLIQGIFPDRESDLNVVGEHMQSGQLADLTAGSYQVIVGRGLANRLDVDIGDEIRLIAASGGRYTPLGMMPAQRLFKVQGIFAVGADIDSQLVLVHGEDAARLLRYPSGAVTGVRYYLKDAFQAERVAGVLRQQVTEELVVQDWSERYGRLFAAVRMEKGMMLFMLGLVVAVAAFNVVSALIMVIHDKRHDIAILQTLGLSRQQVYAMLTVQGLYNGVVGTLLGVGLGLLATYSLNSILTLFNLGVMAQMEGGGLPVLVIPEQIVMIALVALVMTLAATLYPAWQAAQVKPAQALRYE